MFFSTQNIRRKLPQPGKALSWQVLGASKAHGHGIQQKTPTEIKPRCFLLFFGGFRFLGVFLGCCCFFCFLGFPCSSELSKHRFSHWPSVFPARVLSSFLLSQTSQPSLRYKRDEESHGRKMPGSQGSEVSILLEQLFWCSAQAAAGSGRLSKS